MGEWLPIPYKPEVGSKADQMFLSNQNDEH
jgi:hypothetical protein